MKSAFIDILGASGVLLEPADLEPYQTDWLGHFSGNTEIVLLPATYEQVQAIVTYCNQEKIALVAAGGRTGLSGGSVPLNGEVVISLERLNKIIDLDTVQRTMQVQAGVITEKVQNTAEEVDLYFPVHFASQGSSQIGGNAATNAGGIHVVKYGGFRDWVLGIKAVTGDGELLEINGDLVKNQTGYDLRNLLIGSEGTLGIILELTLKLTSKPKSLTRVLGSLSKLDSMLNVLEETRKKFPSVSAFEYFDRLGIAKVFKHSKLRDPFSKAYDSYLLVEFEDLTDSEEESLASYFAELIEDGVLEDCILAQSRAQADELLGIRERIPEVLGQEYNIHKNDISVPLRKVPELLNRLQEILPAINSQVEWSAFGHFGDGNIHLNIIHPEGMSDEEFENFCTVSDKEVFELISSLSGSISAEHGVGLLKKPYLKYTRTEKEIELMRGIKRVFDPNNILNPGKIFDA